MSQKNRLDLHLVAEVEEREDRWAMYSREFGFYAYGKSRDEANQDFLAGVSAILESFGSVSELRDYLERRAIRYSFSEEGTQATVAGPFSVSGKIKDMIVEGEREVEFAVAR